MDVTTVLVIMSHKVTILNLADDIGRIKSDQIEYHVYVSLDFELPGNYVPIYIVM